jgi:putative ABC transport system permease protein
MSKAVRVDVLEGARIAFFSLGANRMRTVLTTVGIGIGVATLLAIVGIIQGLNSAFERQLAVIGSNTLYVSKWPMVVTGDWWMYRNRKSFTLPQVEQIRSQSSYVSAISPVSGRTVDVAHGTTELSAVRANGVTHEYLTISGFEVTSGRFLSEADDAITRPVVVIGAEVADSLFPGLNPLGRTLRIEDRPFQIIGTLSRKGRFLTDNLDMVVMVPFKTFYATFGKSRPFSISIAVERSEDLRPAEDQLIGIMRRIRGTPADQPDDFSINRPEQLAKTYDQLTGALYGVAVGVASSPCWWAASAS